MMRLRHTDQLVGLLVLLAVLVLLGGILQAGVLGRWFQPTSTLRIVLPETGGGGLAQGAEIEVLGVHAGIIRRIVINPRQGMFAEAEIDGQIRDIIPRDSTAIIRRRYGIAGAYEKLKEATRGKRVTAEDLHALIRTLAIPEAERARLLALTPASYIGMAATLARRA